MNPGLNRVVSVIVAGSLMVSSTGAVAATASAPITQPNPWAALAAMSGGAPAASLCGAAAVAAAVQAPPAGCVLPALDGAPPVATSGPPQPIPVPPVEPAGAGLGIDPLWLGLGAVLAGLALYFLVLNDNDDGDSPD